MKTKIFYALVIAAITAGLAIALAGKSTVPAPMLDHYKANR